ncbi:MAG: penicillin-binding protein 2 [Candidatus Moraniibacteriota bacterium]|nr:MAG: penicillin-binding protein 2 [Candidatus Moranbacteria bacterium]
MSALRRAIRPTKPARTAEAASHWRLYFFRGSLFLVGLVIVGRLYVLQVVGREKWIAMAEEQHTVAQALRAEWGSIALRDGDLAYPVAVNREYKLAYVIPKLVEDVAGTAVALSAVLGVDESLVRERLSDRADPFEVIKKKITPEEEAKLKELKLKGVNFLPEVYRYYPAGELASKVIGFVGPSDLGEIGIYGVEAGWNGELHGRDGTLSQERDAAGRWISLTDREHVEPEDGDSLVLTIDRVIQYEVEKILAESREKFNADSGSAVVLEPKTGKILAMASVPQFNPNEYGKTEDIGLFMNPIISLPYESGSVMKPITMAIGIEEGKVSPHTEFVDTGVVNEAGYNIQNAEGKVYGRSTMTKVLEESINTGVMYVERLVGHGAFRDRLRSFGFGAKTGIRLPAEHPGNLKNLDNLKSTIQFLTASFGQGITVTSLQLAMAYGALANGGVLMKPQIVDRVIDRDGEVRPIEPEEVRRVVSQETSKAMGEMLRSVVVNGHGKRADVPGYLVGGKTGTAQVAKSGSKGYDENITIGSFVGYAPINDPRFVIVVKFDNPKDVQWAESSAAPAFGSIMRFLLSYAKVPTTEPIKK